MFFVVCFHLTSFLPLLFSRIPRLSFGCLSLKVLAFETLALLILFPANFLLSLDYLLFFLCYLLFFPFSGFPLPHFCALASSPDFRIPFIHPTLIAYSTQLANAPLPPPPPPSTFGFFFAVRRGRGKMIEWTVKEKSERERSGAEVWETQLANAALPAPPPPPPLFTFGFFFAVRGEQREEKRRPKGTAEKGNEVKMSGKEMNTARSLLLRHFLPRLPCFAVRGVMRRAKAWEVGGSEVRMHGEDERQRSREEMNTARNLLMHLFLRLRLRLRFRLRLRHPHLAFSSR